MALRSLLAAILAVASPVAAQITALPAVTAPAANTCGGCYVVAEVAGIIFGGVATQTQTNVVSIGQGRNGSLTTTSILEGSSPVTFVSGAPVTNGIATSFNPLSSVITVGNATLTSPTSYEVFSAYSVTRTVSGPNGCSVSSGSATTLPVASSYPIPANVDSDFLLQAESSFISAIGFPECSAGGGQVQSTVHSMITTTTASITTTGVIRPTPVAVSVIPSTTVVVVGNGTGPSASFTIVPFTGAAARPVPSSAPLAVALVCAAMLARWL